MGQPSPPPQISPDGKFYWDGTKWVPVAASPAPTPGLQKPFAASGEVDFEAVHRRATIARVLALPIGLALIVIGGLYDVIGWVFWAIAILFVLTIIVPPVLERLPMPLSWANSELVQLAVSGLLLAIAYLGVRGAIHPHWIGWSEFIRGLLAR